MDILYDANPDKDLAAFKAALIQRSKENKEKGIDDYSRIIFPCDITWVDKIIFKDDRIIDNLPDNCKQVGNEILVEGGFILGKENISNWQGKVEKEFKAANFSNSKFLGVANFSSTLFLGNADFRDSQFSDYADFSDSQFIGNGDFLCHADFGQAEFKGDANFIMSEFSGIANFRESKFRGYAHFIYSQFTGNEEYGGEANFWKSEFKGEANFWNSQFTGETNFSESKFLGHTNFREIRFTGEANFRESEFTGEANFRESEFTAEANFSKSKFTSEAYFSNSDFLDEADFSQSKFLGIADFRGVLFLEIAVFYDAKFSSNLYLRNAMFFRNVDFRWVKFLGNRSSLINILTIDETSFNFNECTFGQDASDLILFENIQKGVMSFERVIIGTEHLKFVNVGLQKASFYLTDLRKIEFTDIKWGKIKENLFSRRVLQDEEEQGKKEGVERLYRQLKQSYEDNREYVEAGEFHFSEKSIQQHRAWEAEMYPLKWWEIHLWIYYALTKQWFWLFLYRYLSGYGERLKPITFWLLLTTFFMPLGYMATGIRLKDKDAVSDFYILAWNEWRESEEQTQKRIKNPQKPYLASADAACLSSALKAGIEQPHWYPHHCQYDEKRNILRDIGSWNGFWNAYGKAFGHSFKVVLPFQERMHVSYSFWGALLTGIHTILAPLLLFLFSATLRQKMKR
jgi:Pentapeptide repeats (9 copies)